MTCYDVFNGDADGICALHQLRLAEPLESILVTGVKRDIALLDRVEAAAGDRITVLDVSLDKNRGALERNLEAGATILYVDHHFAGEIPRHPSLHALIDTDPATCTSLLVDAHLGGTHRSWAVTAAFGDNLYESARRAAEPLGLSEAQLESLRELGTLINYNGYGAAIEDLWFPPDELYRLIRPFADPFAFMAEEPAFRRLKEGFAEDREKAGAVEPHIEEDCMAVYLFPAEPWARRVSGVHANELARDFPDRAHALLTGKPEGGYVVSVRAPVNNRTGADELCRRFPTGGGRKAAAGINHLPEEALDDFVAAMREQYCAS